MKGRLPKSVNLDDTGTFVYQLLHTIIVSIPTGDMKRCLTKRIHGIDDLSEVLDIAVEDVLEPLALSGLDERAEKAPVDKAPPSGQIIGEGKHVGIVAEPLEEGAEEEAQDQEEAEDWVDYLQHCCGGFFLQGVTESDRGQAALVAANPEETLAATHDFRTRI